MPLPKYFLDFKRIVETTLRGVRQLSLRHFNAEYDYDDFLEGEGATCTTARNLVIAFGSRYLDAVPPEYSQALSMAIVSFLAECSGRKRIDETDIDAIKTLAAMATKDEFQLSKWLDAYFPDVL